MPRTLQTQDRSTATGHQYASGFVDGALGSRRRRSPGEQLLTRRDIEIVAWLAEQYAGRVDHVQQLLGCGPRQTSRVIARLRAHRLVDCELLVGSEPRWVIPTPLGLRLSGTGFRLWHPNLALLAHCAAVNDVRLHIEHRSPEAEWTSERALAREYGYKGHRPDGVVVLDGKSVAVEVELTPKSKARTRAIIDLLCHRYDTVLYFAAPAAHQELVKLAGQGRWANLGIRELPHGRGES